MRRFVGALGSVLVTSALCVIGGATLAPASQAAPTAGSTSSAREAVIVILSDQLNSTAMSKSNSSRRRAAAIQSQDAVLGRLPGPKPTRVRHYTLRNATAMIVSKSQVAQLQADPAVAAVLPDVAVSMTPQNPGSAPATSGSKGATPPVPGGEPSQAICPTDPAHPLLEPEALTSIHAASTDGSPSAADLDDGSGVSVAFLADNMDPNYADFIRPDGSHVFVDYQDFSGDGPNTTSAGAEAFGDASSIAAQGVVVHDLSQFVNQAHPLPTGCNIVVKGVAPGASLIGLNVFGDTATNSAVLQAIDYAVTVDHVDVINESLGLNQYPDSSSRALFQQFNDLAVAAGVTVTTSTGDAGVTSTIGSPATDPNVIAVGATTDNGLYAQTSDAAFPFSNGRWISDNISALSSAGVTQDGRTLDLVAPGEGNWADCSPAYSECRSFTSPPQPTDLESFGGTSESAPLTAGVAALVIQAYRQTHSGQSPTPALVKQIITGSADDLGLPADEQGAGLLNARSAVEAALTAPGATDVPEGFPAHLAISDDQISLKGAAGSVQSAHVTVTNMGDTATDVRVDTRKFVTKSSTSMTVDFSSGRQPFTYYNGATWLAKSATFSVPTGAERLVERMTWAGGASKVVRMTLLAPDGTFVANSRPQGGGATGNYAMVDVRSPAPGTWTVVLYTSTDAAGYTGNVQLATDIQHTTRLKTAAPSTVHLAAGQSAPVTVDVPVLGGGRQGVNSITFTTAAGLATTTSVITRSLVTTKFDGTITGGNARDNSPAQTFSYEFDVAADRRNLEVDTTLQAAGTVVDGVLEDPNGELADVNSNLYLSPEGDSLFQGNTLEMAVARPLPGRWHMVLVVQNPVSGSALNQPFTGTIKYNRFKATTADLPTRTRTKLAAGQPVQAEIDVVNTTNESIAVGIDPRLDQTASLTAQPVQGSTDTALPASVTDEPVYVVPPDTSQFDLTTVSSVPAQAELQNGAAGLDVFGDLTQAKLGDTTSTATISETNGTVTKGIWFGLLQEIGPFGPDGATTGQAHLSATLQTDAFDHTVTSSTGDPYDFAVDPAGTGGSPLVLTPGQSVVITVTLTPQGEPGTAVSGHLNLVTVPILPTGNTGLPFYGTGEVLAVLPYKYTVS